MMREAETRPPKLSILIGSQNAKQTIIECLTSIERQGVNESVEIIVADYSTDGTAEIIERKFPSVKLIKFTKPMLIPELWGAGIFHCSGEVIAITTAHCIPAQNWVSEILKAHNSSYAAVGGAIECMEGASLVDWAIYFCRYSSYMEPFSKGIVQEIPGDNASYKREALERCKELLENGFWEIVVNARLRRDGMELLALPSIVVYYKKSFDAAAFIRQRYYHGTHFGSTRAMDFSLLKRIVYILMSPLIPFIIFSHISRQVFKKKRHLKEFVLSSPILFLFLSSWATGEFYGYLLSLWKTRKILNSPLS